MVEIKPPATYAVNGGYKIFLAGSIEMGKAEDWQTRTAAAFKDIDNVFILNPRRDDWDASWVQSIDNKQFNEQVTWELSALEDADLIMYYFVAGTQSPISLLELGLYANTDKMIFVCCPEGFWRKGNIEMVCDRYHIPMYENIDTMIGEIKRYVPIWMKSSKVVDSTEGLSYTINKSPR
jgi:hypothetical protein